MQFCIVGTSRSGSTLLRSLLHASPNIAVFNETQWLPILQEEFGTNEASFLTLLNQAMAVTWASGQNLIEHNIEQQAVDSQAAYERLDAAKNQNKNFTVSGFHEEIKNVIFGDKPHKIWGDKTPDYGPYMRSIQSLWPTCKFIHITRDPVDCALSMQRHRGCSILINANKTSWVEIAKDGEFKKYSDQMPSLEQCFESWHNKMFAIRQESKALSPDSYLEIQYEQLITQPEITLTKIFDYLKIPFTKTNAVTKAIRSIHQKSIKKTTIRDPLTPLSIKRLPNTFASPSIDKDNLPIKPLEKLIIKPKKPHPLKR